MSDFNVNINLVKHPSKGTLFKVTKNDGTTSESKVISAEDMYKVLGSLLHKQNILFQTGYMPVNLRSIEETTNYTKLIYHYPYIAYDFNFTTSNETDGFAEYLANLGYGFSTETVNTRPYSKIKGLTVENVMLEVTIPRNSDERVKYYVGLYTPQNSFNNRYDSNNFIFGVFPNHFSSGQICWGDNNDLGGLYHTGYRDRSLEENYNIYNGLVRSYLGSAFNSDISDTLVLNFINSGSNHFYNNFVEYLSEEFHNYIESTLCCDYVKVPLFLDFLSKQTEEVKANVYAQLKEYSRE